MPRKPLLFVVGIVAAALAASTWAAAQDTGGRAVKRPRLTRPAAEPPPEHSTAVDGSPVFVVAEGFTYSAWAYRSDGEFSIAISHRDIDHDWSEPTFIGLGDGLDQISPALAADEFGNLYLAYVVEPLGQVWMTARWSPNPGSRWFEPQRIAIGRGRAATPALAVVNGSVVLGYDSESSGVRLLDWVALPPAPTGFQTDGIQEGPDGFPVTGLSAPNNHGGRDTTPDPGNDDGTTDPTRSGTRAQSNGRKS